MTPAAKTHEPLGLRRAALGVLQFMLGVLALLLGALTLPPGAPGTSDERSAAALASDVEALTPSMREADVPRREVCLDALEAAHAIDDPAPPTPGERLVAEHRPGRAAQPAAAGPSRRRAAGLHGEPGTSAEARSDRPGASRAARGSARAPSSWPLAAISHPDHA